LQDLTPTFAEAYRLLKKGGVFYADLDPNYYYWDMIKNIQNIKTSNEIIKREIKSVLDRVSEISEQFNLDKEIIMLAEYQKTVKGGLKEEDIIRLLQKVGFVSVDFRYEWYLGQAFYFHNEPENSVIIENYLKIFLPATRHLFKYFSFLAKK
jgi:ubiquinone/menaquinone biosynthesis C-methylase UbiE